ncbi:MAG TPA: LysR family transcriptional regulator [Polyangiaceae bacterium]|nr:LysR family transcriptional regulator [Polyangiaceae bacterium]
MSHMNAVHVPDLDLNLLRVLAALLRHRSVTLAARMLGLSQSATSHALSRLRRELGDPLFIRDKQGLVTTARAEALAEPLFQLLGDLERVLTPPAPFDPRQAQNRFSVATNDYAELLVLPKLVHRLGRDAPSVDLWFRALGTQGVHRALEHNDVVIGPSFPSSELDGAIAARALFEDRFVSVLRKGHPAMRKRWSAEQFAALDHLLVAPGGKPGGTVDTALGRLGLRRRVAVGVPNFAAAPFLVVQTDLVLTVPERVARFIGQTLPLEIIEPPLELPSVTMTLYWHQRFQNDPAHGWLRTQIATSGTELEGGSRQRKRK